ncbi:MAG: DNA-3-methyladenine glycosylase [Spirochaetales bacterium]|nr:DNA-3-methyladenine glycosylase [Spirochaetales bacterium]
MEKRVNSELLADSFYQVDADTLAKALLGKVLKRTFPNGLTASGRICETEAYSQDDPASHTFNGPTERNRAMFGLGGRAYVYISYGIHCCLNCVAGPEGDGSGVLIRGLFPLTGRELMIMNRGCETWPEDRLKRSLLNGPGKIGQAMALDLSLNGHPFSEPPLQILDDGTYVSEEELGQTPRIGITKGADRLRRYLWEPYGMD